MVKIIITGPESTGKSTLAKNLATHLGEPWVPEFSRYFIPSLHGPYSPDHFAIMAQGQLHWQQLYRSIARNYLICDTGLEALFIWFKFRFEGVANPIPESWNPSTEDLYLLCSPDIPWEYDPLREAPYRREEIFTAFKDLLLMENLTFYTVCGQTPQERLTSALSALAQADAGLLRDSR